MDMKINSKLLIKERKTRAWSQQHLAEVSNLNLRTIQRIESSGNSSPESTKAIAASFNLKPNDLLTQNRNHKPIIDKLKKLTALTALVTLVLFYPLSLVTAKSIMLDVKVEKDGTEYIESSMLNEDGEESEIRVEKQLKLLLLSEITKEDQILISIKIYSYSESNGYKLIQKPKILTVDNKAATIIFSDDEGEKYSIRVTPHISV